MKKALLPVLTAVLALTAPPYLVSAVVTTELADETELASYFACQLEGAAYQMPCTVEEMEKNGWELSVDPEVEVMAGLSYAPGRMKKDGHEITAYLLNGSLDAVSCKESYVVGFSVYEDDQVSMVTGAGITFGSTLEEVEAAYGEDEDVADVGYITYEYTIPGNESLPEISNVIGGNSLEFDFNGEEKVSSIRLQYFMAPEDGSPQDPPSEEMPAVYESYEKPEELGEDLTSFRCSVNDNVYTLPVPVSEVAEEDLVFDRERIIPGLNETAVTDNIYVKNPLEKHIRAENGFISNLVLNSGTAAGKTVPEVTLPGNISVGSTVEELKEACSQFKDKEPGMYEEDGITYWVGEEDMYFSINDYENGKELVFIIEDGKISTISMRCASWPEKAS